MLVGAVVQRLGAVVLVVIAAVAAGSSDGSVAYAADGCASGPVYTVRSGDGWLRVAERVGVTVHALLAANGATIDAPLVVGQTVCLPAGADLTAACEHTTTVAPGDGWSTIARRVGAVMSSVLAANGADASRVLHPGDVVCLPAGATTTSSSATASAATGGSYEVVRGDSWFGIAARAGVSLRSLLAVNAASADDRLLPGDMIALPAGATQPSPRASRAGGGRLDALPVQGPCWYADTWRAPRGNGRRHAGVDIITFDGSYVYAVTDGRLTGRTWAQPGRISGNAWTLTAYDGTEYFYAHLFDFAPGLRVGSTVEAGEIIGWVGDTGNASAPHLHFEIRPGGGSPVNPYPAVAAAGGCNRGTPYRQPSGWIPD